MKVLMLIYGFLTFLGIFNIWNIADQSITIELGGFSFTVSTFAAAIAIVGGIAAVAIIAGINVLGSGLQDSSITILFKSLAFLLPYIFLMIVNQSFFALIPYNLAFQALLTLIFLVAVGENVGGGG